MLCQSPHGPATLHEKGHSDTKVRLVEVVIALSENKVGRNIALECTDGGTEVDRFFGVGKLGYTSAQLLDFPVDQVLAAQNAGFGKVGI